MRHSYCFNPTETMSRVLQWNIHRLVLRQGAFAFAIHNLYMFLSEEYFRWLLSCCYIVCLCQ